MLTHDKILIFDFETSGLSPLNSQIIEIGALLLKKEQGQYRVAEELSCLVTCDYPLPLKITDITHITDDMLLRDGISELEAFNKLHMLYDSTTLLVAYNIQFDLGFLLELFKKYLDKQFMFNNDILDVMAIYRDRHKFPHRLESAVQNYGIRFPNTHRALDDVKATLEVLKMMKIENDNLGHYVNKIGYNKKYGVSGPKLSHVAYIAQYGGNKEIEKS